MPAYLVVGDPNRIKADLERHFDEADRCEVRTGVWFVRSELSTSRAVAEHLGFYSNRHGLVVTAQYYAGIARSQIVEKVRGWETDNA